MSGKGIHSQDRDPGAHHDVVLGPLALQASPASPARASPARHPLVLWGKSQTPVAVLEKGPSTRLRCHAGATAQPQHPGTTGALAPEAAHKPPSGPKPGAHAFCLLNNKYDDDNDDDDDDYSWGIERWLKWD